MINEELSKRAWKNVHMSDYIENSDTEMWQGYVEQAKEIILKNEYMTIEEKEKAIEKYKNKTADWINADRKNNANHVSQFICGAGNYNMKKHQKFLDRGNTLMKEREYIFDVNNYIRHAKIKNEIIQKEIESKEYILGTTKVIQNTELNRLQLEFKDKPNDETRKTLKSNGFKWSPKNQTWQRQLTKNAIYSLKRIQNYL